MKLKKQQIWHLKWTDAIKKLFTIEMNTTSLKKSKKSNCQMLFLSMIVSIQQKSIMAIANAQTTKVVTNDKHVINNRKQILNLIFFDI
ncbi:hypothetical protein BpHYR1_042761 [Brachionus plicatilis]|uniref:Uncharacterized protein n=1 Tax=Brachionus plicatilis TaxID=10195 RepID=A0A3M7R8Q1_BRAPC|nr:hypothetical protein BpHYR1_042761 [Brachionus plicatilis]